MNQIPPGVANLEGALRLVLAPEDLAVAVGVEGRVNVFEVNAGVGQFLGLLQIVAAADDERVNEGGGALWCSGRLLRVE